MKKNRKANESGADIRVLFATHSLTGGGAERQLALLSENLPDHYQRVVWSLKGGPFVDELKSKGIKVYVEERTHRFDLSQGISLLNLIRNWKPDIIHSWSWMASAVSVVPSKFYNIPLIDSTIRMGMLLKRRVFVNKLFQRLSSAVVANSRAGLEAWDVPEKLGNVIYNGFEMSRLNSCTTIEYEKKCFTIIMAARMVPEKDYLALIKTAKVLETSDNSSEYLFVCLGTGPERKTIQDKAISFQENVHFLFPDETREIIPFLKSGSIGVLLTNHEIIAEGCSNAIIEYMACGLPVIATDSGGNGEVIINGKTGFIVSQKNDPEEIAERILWIKQNSEKAREIGMAGKDRVVEYFSVHKMVMQYVDLYSDLLVKYM